MTSLTILTSRFRRHNGDSADCIRVIRCSWKVGLAEEREAPFVDVRRDAAAVRRTRRGGASDGDSALKMNEIEMRGIRAAAIKNNWILGDKVADFKQELILKVGAMSANN